MITFAMMRSAIRMLVMGLSSPLIDRMDLGYGITTWSATNIYEHAGVSFWYNPASMSNNQNNSRFSIMLSAFYKGHPIDICSMEEREPYTTYLNTFSSDIPSIKLLSLSTMVDEVTLSSICEHLVTRLNKQINEIDNYVKRKSK